MGILLMTIDGRNLSGLASEANHKVPFRLTRKYTNKINYRTIGLACQCFIK